MEETEQIVQRRKGRCMAQLLEVFEDELEPLLPAEKAQEFKALVRRKLNAFASDVSELMAMRAQGEERNGVAQDTIDRLHADSRGRQ